MAEAVAAGIGHALRIEAAITPRAVPDRLLALRLGGDHRAEKQADRGTGGRRTCAVATAMIMVVMMVLHLDEQ